MGASLRQRKQSGQMLYQVYEYSAYQPSGVACVRSKRPAGVGGSARFDLVCTAKRHGEISQVDPWDQLGPGMVYIEVLTVPREFRLALVARML